eukprot:ANDGO_05031.mRNA.1 Cytochrome b5 isoform B
MSNERVITRAEIEQHESIQSCWMAIHGKVYDVTKFLDLHPGGPDVLIQQGGGDATNGFENVGHSEAARKQMEEYYIGVYDAPQKKKKNSGDASASSNSIATLLKYIVPAAAVAFAVYVRFFAKPIPNMA